MRCPNTYSELSIYEWISQMKTPKCGSFFNELPQDKSWNADESGKLLPINQFHLHFKLHPVGVH